MARFEVEANGQRYEVEAPDAQSAVAAIQGLSAPASVEPSQQPVTEVAPQPEREGLFPQFASGMTEGAANLLSVPNSLEMGLRSIGPAIGNAMGGDFSYPQESVLPDMGQSLRNFAGNTGAMTAPSQDMGGRIVRRVGQEIGANIIPMAGSASRAGSVAQALAQGGAELGLTTASGLGAGVANEAFPDNPIADMVGQGLGLATGVGLMEGGRRLITPNPMSADRLAVAQALRDEGIDLTAGQATGNKRLQYMESELGGDVAQQFMENQGDQFTNAALDRIGVSAPRATPEVLNTAYRNIGDEFDRLAAQSSVPVDQTFVTDLQNTVNNYENLLESSAAPAVQKYVDEIYEHAAKSPAGQPMLTGEQYKSLRSRIGFDMRRTSKSELADALGDIQSALDDSVERYLAVASPDDIPAWQDVRNQYRNFLVIEKAASGAGENAARGILSPAQIRNAIVQQSRRGYVRGMGDFADLARNANATMTPLPNSGTAQRLGARGGMMGLPAIGGTLLGGVVGGGNPLAAVAGGVAGNAIPGQVGRALLSGPGRAYLTNQIATPGAGYGQSTANAVARALAAQGQFDQ